MASARGGYGLQRYRTVRLREVSVECVVLRWRVGGAGCPSSRRGRPRTVLRRREHFSAVLAHHAGHGAAEGIAEGQESRSIASSES